MNIWFTSDSHFSHKNIIQYENRPFKDITEMNNILIENWNKVVKPEDTVWHLGDIFFCGTDLKKKIMGQLNGKKILLRGNHDKSTVSHYLEIGFEKVITKDSQTFPFIITHRPLENTDQKNVHGHVHSKIGGLDQTKYKCVSVEMTNYTPVHLDEIMKWMKN